MIPCIRKDAGACVDMLSAGYRPSNLGLAFSRLCREIDEPERKEHGAKDQALALLNRGIPDETRELYIHAFRERKESLLKQPDCLCFEMNLTSPLLIGMGDENIHEFGISLLRPWGVPFIPGSALKGVASSYAAEFGGHEWQKSHAGKKIPGGELALFLFGGIDSQKESYAGVVDFADAWCCPVAQPFITDIINPHYGKYYAGEREADGVESPIPFSLACLKPGIQFFFVLRGDPGWCQIAREILCRAAAETGIGAKTRAGYGRFQPVKSALDFLAEIPNATDTELKELFRAKGDNREFEEAFRIEAFGRPYSKELETLFKKYRPVFVLYQKLKEKKNLTFRDARDIRQREFGGLRAGQIQPSDPDVQAVFMLCLPLLPRGEDLAGTWLQAFAVPVAELLRGKEAEAIVDMVENYEGPWPTRQEFLKAIQEAEWLIAEDKELCKEMLEG